MVLPLFGKYLGVKLLDHVVGIFQLLKKPPNCSLHSYQQLSPTLGLVSLLNFAILIGVYLIVNVIYISMLTDDSKHLFMCLFAICDGGSQDHPYAFSESLKGFMGLSI